MQRIAKNSAVANAHARSGDGKRAFVASRRAVAWSRVRGLAVVAGGSAAQAWIHGQQASIPAIPMPDAFRLPYDFEPVIRLRTFYKNTETLTGRRAGGVGARRLRGTAQPVVRRSLPVRRRRLYVAEALRARRARAARCCCSRTSLRSTVLGEAWGAVRVAGQTITGYRQLIDRPFINPQDTREIPNTFEAYTLTGASGALSYTGGYMTKMKTRGSEDFLWASQVAGGKGAARRRDLRGRDVRVRGNGLPQARRGVLDRRVQHVLHRRPVSDPDRRQDAAHAGRAVLSAEVGRRRPDRIVLDVGLRPQRGADLRAGDRTALLHADRQGLHDAEPLWR